MKGSLRLRAAFRVFRKSSTKISNRELLSQLFLLINEFFYSPVVVALKLKQLLCQDYSG